MQCIFDEQENVSVHIKLEFTYNITVCTVRATRVEELPLS